MFKTKDVPIWKRKRLHKCLFSKCLGQIGFLNIQDKIRKSVQTFGQTFEKFKHLCKCLQRCKCLYKQTFEMFEQMLQMFGNFQTFEKIYFKDFLEKFQTFDQTFKFFKHLSFVSNVC